MIKTFTYCLCSLLFITGSLAASVSGLTFSKASAYMMYEKVEATFSLSGTSYTNPYNPDEIIVDAVISLPGGGTVTVPCFYYVPVTFTGSNASEISNGSTWMLRYTPKVAGNYSLVINVTEGTVTNTSASSSFEVTAGTAKGFIKVDPTNTQFYRFENGSPYYPNGFNLAWNDGTLATFYHNTLNKMGENHVTWTRYWLADFGRQALEWTNDPTYWGGWYKGLGNYNQKSAALLDTALSLCQANNVYMQLVLQHHGQFSIDVDSEWDPSTTNDHPGSPYNTKNGGPISNPVQFFTDSASKAQAKKMYRYLIARYSYSTNIFAWELFNEVEFTHASDASMDAWHDQMSQYIKNLDPAKHLITTSSGEDNSLLPLLDDNSAMDILQFHIYKDIPEKAVYDQSQAINAAITKPVLVGEYGPAPANFGNMVNDAWGDLVRKTSWVGQFTEVPAEYWFWSEYIIANNKFDIYKPLGMFLEGTDIVQETGGNYAKLKFSQNPAISTTVTAVPGLGWGNSTKKDFVVDATGNIEGLSGLSSFLSSQSWHPGMGDYASFQVNYFSAGTAKITASPSTNLPNTLEVFIDNVSAGIHDFNISNSYSVNVPAGLHTIRFKFTGQDWVNVSSYEFNPVAIQKATGYGYSGTTKAYGYIYDQTYGEWADPASVESVTVVAKVGPLNRGTYEVEAFNPQTGVSAIQAEQESVFTQGDSISIVLSFKKDVAYKVRQISSEPTAIAVPAPEETGIKAYPNPAESLLRLELSEGGVHKIIIYNEMGEEVLENEALGDIVTLNVAGLPSSIYFITVYNGSQLKKLKFIRK